MAALRGRNATGAEPLGPSKVVAELHKKPNAINISELAQSKVLTNSG